MSTVWLRSTAGAGALAIADSMRLRVRSKPSALILSSASAIRCHASGQQRESLSILLLYLVNAHSATASSMMQAVLNTLQDVSHEAKLAGPGISFFKYVPSGCGSHATNFIARTTFLLNGPHIARSAYGALLRTETFTCKACSCSAVGSSSSSGAPSAKVL